MYDVIVIGNDLSSLVTAQSLSVSGFKTLYISHDPFNESIEDSSYSFDYPLLLTGIAPSQRFFNLFFDQLKVPVSVGERIKSQNPGFQIILPDHRIEFFSHADGFFNEMVREFKEDEEAIRRLIGCLSQNSSIVNTLFFENLSQYSSKIKKMIRCIPGIVRGKVTLAKVFSVLKHSEPIKRILETLVFLFSNRFQESIESNLLGLSFLAQYPVREVCYFSGGKKKLHQILQMNLSESGGTILTNPRIREIRVRKNADIEIDVSGASTIIRGKYLVLSSKWHGLQQYVLANNRIPRNLRRRSIRTKIARYPFTVYMGVSDKVLPEKIAPYCALVIDQEKPVWDNNLIYLETSLADDRESAPEGMRALTATVFLQENPLEMSDKELVMISEKTITNLETFLFFLQEHIDFIDIHHSIRLSRMYQDMVNVKYLVKINPFSACANITEGKLLSNVYLLGGMSSELLGFEGEMLSALNVVKALIENKGGRCND